MNRSHFKPLHKRRSVAEEISTRILTLLRERELRPGDKLPPERELAAMLQVSRPSLREALSALALMNVIEIRQGDGTYVTSLEPHRLLEQLEFIFHLDSSLIAQLFEARKIVEVGCVALAAGRIDDEGIQQLEGIVERSQQSFGDAEAFLHADLDLHRVVSESSCNPVLIRFMESISYLGKQSRKITGTSLAVRRRSIQDHKAIVAALKAHDPIAASAAMMQHLDNVEKSLGTET
ncbi:MAG: FadR/GntR family transcriptional regulator [Chloroflexota bacterium]